MAPTIKADGRGLLLFFTAYRRIDKHGEKTIVFLVSTYNIKPSAHVNSYKKHRLVEKVIRTCKQYLGLQECFSTVFETQQDHVTSVFLPIRCCNST